ncbi:MAG: hypothetical protein MUO27_06175 [Sedimentisphaerales bacterium]|nr:hypothetical protein [Sedimentisphaerales bacterium]
MPSFPVILKVAAAVCVLIGLVVGFVFLEKYVKKTSPITQKAAPIELVDVPDWVTEPLKEKIYAAASPDGEDLGIDENTASLVHRNIETSVAWIQQVKVQVTHDAVRVSGCWRKPLALVRQGSQSFYVDEESVVMDFVPMPNLPIVKVEGLSPAAKPPLPADTWQGGDLAAAVDILTRLQKMDKLISPDKPLLGTIDRIDVSTFNGRKNNRLPHIILYTKDNTEIIWGAEIGTWQRHLEATDEEKLTNLYAYYKEHGLLLGGAKYINLQYSQVNVSLPVDKY